MEKKSVDDICEFLEGKGYPYAVVDNFRDEEYDGEAVAAALSSSVSCDWLKDVVPKAGLRFKIHQSLKILSEDCQLSLSSSSSAVLNTSCASGSSETDNSSSQPTMKYPKLERLPDPFLIPKFRPKTEENFDKCLLTDGDRKYVVQTLATMLMTHVPKPSLKNCSAVAKSLIAEYPFLKDSEGDGDHSWKWFIYYRCQNVNRGSSAAVECPRKRPKVVDKSMHVYPPTHAEDEVSYSRNLALLKEEQQKAKPRVQVLKDLMKRTFSNRWSTFLAGTQPLSSYLAEFPLLTKPVYASQEFSLLCKKPSIRDDFENSFIHWAKAIMQYCKDTQLKSTALKEETKNFTPDLSDNVIASMALRCLALLFAPIKTKKLEENIPFIMKVVPVTISKGELTVPSVRILNVAHYTTLDNLGSSKRGTPADQASDAGNNQPHIVLFKADDDSDDPELQQYFISIEQNLMLESKSLIAAIYYCIAVHYIYNLSYHPKSGDVWVYIQSQIFGLECKGNAKKLPSSRCHFSGIARYHSSIFVDNNSDSETTD